MIWAADLLGYILDLTQYPVDGLTRKGATKVPLRYDKNVVGVSQLPLKAPTTAESVCQGNSAYQLFMER